MCDNQEYLRNMRNEYLHKNATNETEYKELIWHV